MRHGRRLMPLLLAAAASAALCSCSSPAFVDAALGLPPDAAVPADDAATQPVAQELALPGADTSAGWSALDPDNADADAARSRFSVPAPTQPTLPAGPEPPEAPIARLEPPARVRFLGREPAVERIRLDPMTSCPQFNANTASDALRVTAGTRSLNATFWSRGTPGLAGLRIGAVPQTLRASDPRTITWSRLPLPSGCREVTTTVSGLRTGDAYQVIVDEQTTSTVTGGARWRTIATSEGVAVR